MVLQKLEEAGIDVEQYSRGPAGKHIFVTRVMWPVSSGVIKYWPGDAELNVFTNKRHHQAVMHVDEDYRELNFSFTHDRSFSRENYDSVDQSALAGRNCKLQLPNTTEYEILDESKNKRWNRNAQQPYKREFRGYRYSYKAVAKVPASEQTFLMGIDETAHFIAELPERVSSVLDAHDILRPDEATKDGTLRQGEWFFVPLSKRMSNDVWAEYERYMTRNPWNTSRTHFNEGVYSLNEDEELGSSHMAQTLFEYGDDVYAFGLIWDSRGGHHKSLALRDWHKVVRNREVVSVTSTRYYD